MTLGHEKLDVYRLSIGYVAWVYEKAETLIGVHRPARDQSLRASQSIPFKAISEKSHTILLVFSPVFRVATTVT
jgi:hypothetical protein